MLLGYPCLVPVKPVVSLGTLTLLQPRSQASPVFSCSSASVYCTGHKLKNKKRGKPGNEVSFTAPSKLGEEAWEHH